ncbi:hypothetical protein [Granulicella sp. S190]|uniref:hypothetical protein n=1 Tax=Granulicella sp. S190 TaxID=1747226 RepID=UPI00131B48AA|nr:hypothetical protein [Granulicella sp. S190]
MKSLVLVLIFLCGGCLRAQVVELSAGTSSLYQSQGGTVSVRSGTYTTSAGAGTINGRFYAGAQLVKATERAKYTFGIDNIPFNLPTDIFDSGHYLTAVGAGVATKAANSKVYAFVGATSTSFNSPFFNAAQAVTPAGILFVTGKVAPQWTASTRVIVSKQVTVLHSFAWNSGDGTQIAFSGGLGSNQLYGAASIAISRPRFDLKAAYYEAGSQFRRADVQTPLSSEPDRENVSFTLRPVKSLTLSAGRQNYLTPVYGTQNNLRSTVNQASANLQVAGVSLSAILLQSSYNGSSDIAMVYSANRDVTPRVHIGVSYLVSRLEGSAEADELISNVQETLNPRWTLSQTVNTSNGQNTFGFGGSFLSNLATLSADYQTYYVPARVGDPFEEALIFNAEIHLFGRLSLNGGTFVAPDGQLLYTAEAEGTVSREQGAGASAFQRYSMGAMMIHGRVIDTMGQPVMGAALLIDQLPVYTDSDGYFYVRERKPREHPLTVLVDQFLNGGNYRVVSAPPKASSSANENQIGTTVVVERIPPVKANHGN